MLILEINAEDKEREREKITRLLEAGAVEIWSKEFQGGETTAQYMLQMVSSSILDAVTAIVIACLKDKRKVAVKHNGHAILGLSEENAYEYLKKLLD